MGCVSSSVVMMGKDEEFSISSSTSGGAFMGHHIVSLTSTTYGLLNLDPPTSDPPLFFLHSPTTTTTKSDPPLPLPQVINSWELMDGLLDPQNPPSSSCPPKVIIYTTTLRGVWKTFEACNAVRSAFQAFGVSFCEKDISMDRGFKDELKELMKKNNNDDHDAVPVPPRVFFNGRYLGGAQELLRIVEEGYFGDLVRDLPKLNKDNKGGFASCEGCGGIRFLPCFKCNGSCKLLLLLNKGAGEITNDYNNIQSNNKHKHRTNDVVVVRCSDCNENGLVVCPVCTY